MMGGVDVSRSCIQKGGEWKRMVSILGVGVTVLCHTWTPDGQGWTLAGGDYKTEKTSGPASRSLHPRSYYQDGIPNNSSWHLTARAGDLFPNGLRRGFWAWLCWTEGPH